MIAEFPLMRLAVKLARASFELTDAQDLAPAAYAGSGEAAIKPKNAATIVLTDRVPIDIVI